MAIKKEVKTKSNTSKNQKANAIENRVIVIEKDGFWHIMIAIPLIIFTFLVPHIGFKILFICLSVDQFIRIDSNLTINLHTKEATFKNLYGTHIVKNIQSIKIMREPTLLFTKFVEVSGFNDSVKLSFPKIYTETENLLRDFKNEK